MADELPRASLQDLPLPLLSAILTRASDVRRAPDALLFRAGGLCRALRLAARGTQACAALNARWVRASVAAVEWLASSAYVRRTALTAAMARLAEDAGRPVAGWYSGKARCVRGGAVTRGMAVVVRSIIANRSRGLRRLALLR
jgi:hypothetical protein